MSRPPVRRPRPKKYVIEDQLEPSGDRDQFHLIRGVPCRCKPPSGSVSTAVITDPTLGALVGRSSRLPGSSTLVTEIATATESSISVLGSPAASLWSWTDSVSS